MPDSIASNSQELEKQRIIREGNISLILDSYEDIFSDFDPRPYQERTLSDDFIFECKRASREKSHQKGTELRLLIPKKQRNKNEEIKIKKRLKEFFSHKNHEKQELKRKEKKQGAAWLLVGSILITMSALIYGKQGLIFNFLVVLLEPAGWFSTWTGLDKLFFGVVQKQTDEEFYKSMAPAEIIFQEY